MVLACEPLWFGTLNHYICKYFLPYALYWWTHCTLLMQLNCKPCFKEIVNGLIQSHDFWRYFKYGTSVLIPLKILSGCLPRLIDAFTLDHFPKAHKHDFYIKPK